MTIEKKLQQLREEWMKYPERRWITERCAKLLKTCQEMNTVQVLHQEITPEDQKKTGEAFIQDVKSAFGC